jgi:hypothetical protein
MLKLNRKTIEYSLVPTALAIMVLLVFATPVAASSSSKTPTIKIIGTGIIWGGPNTWVTSTYRFGTGPVFVTPGETVKLVDNTVDAHTLTLVTSSVEPHNGSAVDQCIDEEDVCGPSGAALSPGTSNYVVGGSISGSGYLCTTSAAACTLSTPFSSTTTPNGDEVLITPGTTLYLSIAPTASPGTIIRFMCIFHPWMQGEFIVT